jgi:CHAD domain-containing protein
MSHRAELHATLYVLDVIAARKLWHQRVFGAFRLVAQPSVMALDVVLDTPTRVLQHAGMTLVLSTREGSHATLWLHTSSAEHTAYPLLHDTQWPAELCASLAQMNAPAHTLIPIASAQTKLQIRQVTDAATVHIATMTLRHGHIHAGSTVREWSDITIAPTNNTDTDTRSEIQTTLEAHVACTIAPQSMQVALVTLSATYAVPQYGDAGLREQLTALAAIGRDADESLLVPLANDDSPANRMIVAAALVHQNGHPYASDPFWMVLDAQQRVIVEALAQPTPNARWPLPVPVRDIRSGPFPDVLRLKLRGQFRRVLLRESAVKEGFHAEDVHRIRVSLRKLNSLLECGVFVYEDEQIAQYRRGFRRMARFLGEVRDADAFADHVKRILGTNTVPHDIRNALQQIRQKALKELELLIGADKHQQFLDSFAGFVCTAEAAAPNSPSTAVFLHSCVNEMMHALTLPMRTPATKLDTETMHEIRIQAKKLRYIIEAFPDVLQPHATPLLTLLERLQHRLGIIQDAATAHRLLITTHLTSHTQAKTVLTTMRAEANYQRTQLESLWSACTSQETQRTLDAITRALGQEGDRL